MPGQFALTPKNRMLRVGGSRVSRTGREESRPLSGPRQIAARVMYKTPQKTSSAPSPIRNIFGSQFIAAPHNRTGINRGKVGFVPGGTTEENKAWGRGKETAPARRVLRPREVYNKSAEGGPSARSYNPPLRRSFHGLAAAGFFVELVYFPSTRVYWTTIGHGRKGGN